MFIIIIVAKKRRVGCTFGKRYKDWHVKQRVRLKNIVGINFIRRVG